MVKLLEFNADLVSIGVLFLVITVIGYSTYMFHYRLKQKKNASFFYKRIFYLILYTISVFLTFSTAYFPVMVESKSEMHSMQFGFPIPFVRQDLSALDPPLPRKISIGSMWEHPTKINIVNLTSSFSIFFLSFFFISYIIMLLVATIKNIK